jgi:hypothetical protein
MITPPSLGPLSTAEIFDTAFRLYRTHFGTFLRIVLSLYGPLILLKFVIAILLIESEEWGNFLGWPLPLGMPYGMTYSSFGHIPMLISGTLRGAEFLFIHPISVGLICNITARSYLQRPAVLQIPHNYNPLRFAILCLSEILFFLIGVIMLISGWMLFETRYLFITERYFIDTDNLLIPFIFIGSIIIYTRLILTPMIIMIEGYRLINSWGRSWDLQRGAVWQAFQIVIVSNLLMAILVFSFGLSIRTLIEYLMPSAQADLFGRLIGHCLYPIMLAFQVIVYTLFYYNLRIRKEAYDLALKLDQTTSIYSSNWNIRPGCLKTILITCLVMIVIIIGFFFLLLTLFSTF